MERMKKEALKAAFKYTSDHDDSLGEVNLPGQTLTLVGLFFFFLHGIVWGTTLQKYCVVYSIREI